MSTTNCPPVRIVNPQGLLPKGISDFDKIVQQRRCFVDKSLFIREVLYRDDDVILITRPRRFGKTTNQRMLQAFFEKSTVETNTRQLFDDLLVSKQADVMQHQGQYPVVSLTFKDIKADCWNQAYDKLRELVYEEIQRHAEALDFQAVDLFARAHGACWSRILQQQQATLNDWEAALKLLCKLLTLYHNQSKPRHEWVRPIVLLDEYDAPIHSAYAHSDKKLLVRAAGQSQDEWQQAFNGTYYGQMVSFMRGLLGGALKDSDYLHKAVITGILRVAKEDIYSGVNNLGVY
ncbi:MAG: AAA family ATPase, partial [Myxococcota bacterium]